MFIHRGIMAEYAQTCVETKTVKEEGKENENDKEGGVSESEVIRHLDT